MANAHMVASPYDAPTRQLPRPTGAAGKARTTTYSFATIPAAQTAPTRKLGKLRNGDGGEGRGLQDLGLLVLRLLVGLSFLYHGLQHLTKWFDGQGLEGTRQMLEQGGWKQVQVAATMLGVSEVGGGALIILGLATPLAAAAVLAAIADAWLWKYSNQMHPHYADLEVESLLAVATAAVILSGPGRWAVDRNTGWATRPRYGSFLCLVLGLVAAGVTWFVLHGGNPFK